MSTFQMEKIMTALQLANHLNRKVVKAGFNSVYDEYEVGNFLTIRIRVKGSDITDVHGNTLSIQQIQFCTN